MHRMHNEFNILSALYIVYILIATSCNILNYFYIFTYIYISNYASVIIIMPTIIPAIIPNVDKKLSNKFLLLGINSPHTI